LVQAGYQVRVAFGEADVSIAAKTKVLAISTDSDMFFAPNVLLCAKPFFGSTVSFQVMTRSKVLRTLDISNSCWTALAVVSGNDYVPNIRGYGIAGNYRILKQFGSTQSIEGLVNCYCSYIKVQNCFGTAISVIVHQEETTLESASDNFISRLNDFDWCSMDESAAANVKELVDIHALHSAWYKYLWTSAQYEMNEFLQRYEDWKAIQRQKAIEKAMQSKEKESNGPGFNSFLPKPLKREHGIGGRYIYKQVDWKAISKSEKPKPIVVVEAKPSKPKGNGY
jgi:5'-3' exonuclease